MNVLSCDIGLLSKEQKTRIADRLHKAIEYRHRYDARKYDRFVELLNNIEHVYDRYGDSLSKYFP